MAISADTLEQERKTLSKSVDSKKKSSLGQYLTPSRTAEFMVSMFSKKNWSAIKLLEPGAGMGSLIVPFYKAWSEGLIKGRTLKVTAVELDQDIIFPLANSIQRLNGAKRKSFSSQIRVEDYVKLATYSIARGEKPEFTHAILNPPYKKINIDSDYRRNLKSAGFETVNLYSAFVGLALRQLERGGELVAIIPRSFCNGPYYKSFREKLIQESAVKHIHLFNKRDAAFSDDDVLQENVIIHLVKGAKQGSVIVSTSQDDSFLGFASHKFPFERIVNPTDKEKFIHLPIQSEDLVIHSPMISTTLETMDLKVSTGPVIDFRVKDHLRKQISGKSVPLLYPHHFRSFELEWPAVDSKKPNAITVNKATEKWLYPNGYYVIVRRFSSKEEKRRITASVFNPKEFSQWEKIGFENHLNIIHCKRKGIDKKIAYGLAVYLNSSIVDQYFRQFNGHTQVNATDLRNMKFPDAKSLCDLGEWVIGKKYRVSQPEIDSALQPLWQ